MGMTHCNSDKKNGKIRVCVDLKKVNATTMRDHYPLPLHVLERVAEFGLTNAPTTFQRLMRATFKEYLRISLEIFLDNLCVYSH